VESVPEHNAWVTDSINSCAGPRDKIYFLGDNAFARNAVEQAGVLKKFLATLKCKNWVFVLGNHDYEGSTLCLGYESHKYLEINWNGIKFFLHHYPCLTWPSSHYGSIHCYGHTHAEFEKTFDALMPQRRSLDCGLENAYRLFGKYRPFEAGEIVEYLKDRKGSFLPSEQDKYKDEVNDAAAKA
jgi:calcineurin-like phosphoesterase family protein